MRLKANQQEIFIILGGDDDARPFKSFYLFIYTCTFCTVCNIYLKKNGWFGCTV